MKTIIKTVLQNPITIEEAYEYGKDYALNGANTTNCNYRIFATQQLKKAWEKGRDSEK